MLKNQNQKVSKDFINYLKNTSDLPLKRGATKKQNQNSQNLNHGTKASHMPIHMMPKSYSPIEGDFSQIGQTYIVKGDRLRKKSFTYKNLNVQQHNQISQNIMPSENIEIIKQIAKLQYLESKGYLKPQEASRLNELRKKNPKFISPDIMNSNKNVHQIKNRQIHPLHPAKEYYEINDQNMNPNVQIYHSKNNLGNNFVENNHPVQYPYRQNINYYDNRYHQQIQNQNGSFIGKGNQFSEGYAQNGNQHQFINSNFGYDPKFKLNNQSFSVKMPLNNNMQPYNQNQAYCHHQNFY